MEEEMYSLIVKDLEWIFKRFYLSELHVSI